jgi:ABC-type arginine transport system permease subunit
LVQEKYQGEKTRDKRQQYNNNNNNNKVCTNVYNSLLRCINRLLVVVLLEYTSSISLAIIHYKRPEMHLTYDDSVISDTERKY